MVTHAKSNWTDVVLSALLAASSFPGVLSQGAPPPDDQAAQAPADKQLTLDLDGGVKLELVLIPAGKFMMGSEKGVPVLPIGGAEKPVHEVTISQPFCMGKYVVIQEQWQAIMGNNPSTFQGAKNPVEGVSWNDAQEFCKKVSEKVAKTVRLPTEAEWEYACRAGSTTEYCFGDAENGLADYAWFSVNSGNTPHPVGEKKPNAWGLYDMHGNVWQ